MAKTSEFSYEVKNIIGKLSEGKEVRVISWNGREAKIDIRAWSTDDNGNEKAGKGICLSNDEAKNLVDLLGKYLEEDDEDDF